MIKSATYLPDFAHHSARINGSNFIWTILDSTQGIPIGRCCLECKVTAVFGDTNVDTS